MTFVVFSTCLLSRGITSAACVMVWIWSDPKGLLLKVWFLIQHIHSWGFEVGGPWDSWHHQWISTFNGFIISWHYWEVMGKFSRWGHAEGSWPIGSCYWGLYYILKCFSVPFFLCFMVLWSKQPPLPHTPATITFCFTIGT